MKTKTLSWRGVATAAAILLIAAVLLVLWTTRESAAVATVDGRPITEEELLFHMKLLRPYVYDEYKNTHGVTLGAGDWLIESDGSGPMADLRERALEAITKDKALFIAAHREKLIPYVDFADMRTSMAKENRSRKAAAERGEILYGLLQFTPDIYYSYVTSSLKTELNKKLSRAQSDPLYVDENEIEQAFRQDKGSWTMNATNYSVTSLNISITDDRKKEGMRKQINSLVEQGASFDDIQEEYAGAVQAKEEFAREDVANLNSYTNEVLGQIRSLSVGQITYPIETNQGLKIMRLDEIRFDEQQAYQEYKLRVRQKLLDEKLEDYLEDYRHALKIEIDWKKLAAVSL